MAHVAREEAGVAETGSKRGPAASEAVDALGIKVPAFIVADVDRIIQFLNVTGLQPETIRESAQSSLFLLGRSTMRQRTMNCRELFIRS
jgi:hypothetical protein